MLLSKKYGVNPSVGMCFWCGEDNGMLYLLGPNKGNEAPHRAVYDYAPCDKCKERRSLGITLIEVMEHAPSENAAPIGNNIWPTGRWCVVKEAMAEQFQPEEFKQKVLQKRMAFVLESDWTAIGLPTDKNEPK